MYYFLESCTVQLSTNNIVKLNLFRFQTLIFIHIIVAFSNHRHLEFNLNLFLLEYLVSAVALPLVLEGGGVCVHLAGGADGLVVVLGVDALADGCGAAVHQRGLRPGPAPPALTPLHLLGTAGGLLVSCDLVRLDQGRVRRPEVSGKARHLLLT